MNYAVARHQPQQHVYGGHEAKGQMGQVVSTSASISTAPSHCPCAGISQGVGEMDGQAIGCTAEGAENEIQVSHICSIIEAKSWTKMLLMAFWYAQGILLLNLASLHIM
jgi:hypothetical protein